VSAAAQRQGLRFLPAAAIVLALLFTLKVAGFGAELSALFGSRTAYAETEAAASEAAPAEAAHEPDAAAHEPEAAAPADEDPAASGPTASEADVMESLAQRREQLDAREREIDMREKVIAAAEKRVEERIAELKTIEQNIETMFGKRDEQEEQQLASLVKTYEAMKPGDAAQIFDKMDLTVTLDVISRIKPAKAAPILAAMKPERAEQVTVELARRYELPKAAEAAPAPDAAPAAPPAAPPAPPPAPGG
jgi:flagellar motility protein MotE (MotC chaperone)